MIAEPRLVVAGLLAALSAGLATRAVLRPSRRLAPRLTPYTQVSRVRLGRPADTGLVVDEGQAGAALGRVFGPAARAAARRCVDLLGGTDDDIRRRLRQAGWTDTDPRRWRLSQAAQLAAWTVSLGAAGLVTGRSAGTVLTLAVLGAAGGFGLTRGPLTRAIDERRLRMRTELYTLAQLLAMLVRTGSSPLQAVSRVTLLGRGPVAGELAVAMGQIAGGTPEQTAFERLAHATPEPAAARLYRLLGASTQLGGDLSAALRALADDLRNRPRRSDRTRRHPQARPDDRRHPAVPRPRDAHLHRRPDPLDHLRPPMTEPHQGEQAVYQALTILATLRARAAAKRRDEDGFAIPELLAIAALSVALLIVLFAALQKLGVDVIDKVRTQIGL